MFSCKNIFFLLKDACKYITLQIVFFVEDELFFKKNMERVRASLVTIFENGFFFLNNENKENTYNTFNSLSVLKNTNNT